MTVEKCLLRIACDDRPGLVARIAGFLAERGCNILEAQQFDDALNNRFFMRVEFNAPAQAFAAIRQQFGPVASELGLDWQMRSASHCAKVAILVSKFDHCLSDLLYRFHIREFNFEIVAIISNHPREALQGTMIGDLPFHHLPVSSDTRREQEAGIRQIIEDTGAELVVLARYMQILSDEMTGFLSGRCINIHHSFLPGFKGAKPYHQAHARGVKMIGATAHYVTPDLDEGPIIHQEVDVVTHADRPEDMIRKGRDVERRVLAEAVRLHLDGRVFVNGERTVVFRS